MRSFGDSIYAGKININEAEMNKKSVRNMEEFKNKSRLRIKKEILFIV